MKIYVLMNFECHDCGSGSLIKGFISMDELKSFVRIEYGIESVEIERFFNVVELDIDASLCH